ncbi:8-amino-7-oxononanoate synthase [Sansalvadorimonas sp. 2012CJ34-2]|uniref:8-amino-7-oxononanoate synthase n=1 Tax=Parendozoicomonas callyspongiae TaxID=2942213 RepID=A0ABT0PIK6_9GAMM|nr:8-amino-7-oxononanoate synthase [Sansalvadorimonas sp. 2012CJ34-2]MCL6271203.1 8-amino-7-oxononanoate synthase [Sansalvadorimonas sp. 2012CJ34-2]
MSAFNLDAALAKRRDDNLYRERKLLGSAQGPEVIVDGRKTLAFCSNDYLGLANHPEVIASFRKATDQYGVGGGASHLVIGHSEAHHKLEEELAEFTGRPRVILFSTGYMANIGVISALLGKRDAVFQDRLNHASLIDAGQLSGARFQRYLHNDPASLELKLQRSETERKLVVTDGVFSMDGDIAPVRELSTVARKHDAWLMVDDAHGFGSVGIGGRGVADLHDMSTEDLPVLVGTLGKAFGTAGAFVAGSEALIETLVQFARTYIYTTSMPPAVAEATRTSLRLLRDEEWRREHLKDLIDQFRSGCEQLGLELMESNTPIQPILVGTAENALAMSAALAEEGILVTAIRPPTVPNGMSRLRVTFSASHTTEHVNRLLSALEKVSKNINGIQAREKMKWQQ